jgi:hypothetical protein
VARTWTGGWLSREPAISLDVVEGAAGTAPRLRIGASTWTFAAGDPYARGPGLDAANAAWIEVRDAMRRLATPFSSRVSVDVDSRVPWAHVAQVLALASVTGVRSVVVGGEGRPLWIGLSGGRRHVGSRPPIAPMTPPARDPRDVHPALLVGIGVALAAIVVLLPLARRRYRRGLPEVRFRPNGTPPG